MEYNIIYNIYSDLRHGGAHSPSFIYYLFLAAWLALEWGDCFLNNIRHVYRFPLASATARRERSNAFDEQPKVNKFIYFIEIKAFDQINIFALGRPASVPSHPQPSFCSTIPIVWRPFSEWQSQIKHRIYWRNANMSDANIIRLTFILWKHDARQFCCSFKMPEIVVALWMSA